MADYNAWLRAEVEASRAATDDDMDQEAFFAELKQRYAGLARGLPVVHGRRKLPRKD